MVAGFFIVSLYKASFILYNLTMKLILASNSPRRKELLSEFGFKFDIIASDFNENGAFLTPAQTVKSFAYGKAKSVKEKISCDCVVLGADTVVVLDGVILGKPKDEADAFNTLKSLSGKTHSVLTGYAILSNEVTIIDYSETLVTFNELSDELISDYVKTKLPLDKAGSYGIQDGFNLVKRYEGSFNNVVGLPVEIIEKKLKSILKK